MRVLVADPSRTMCAFLAFVLRAFRDLELTQTHDGKHALETALGGGFDLVLLDVILPQIEGVDVLSLMRARPETAKVPVIILASQIDDEERVRATELGVHYVLRKPVQAHQVHDAVAAELHLPAPPNPHGPERRRDFRLSVEVTMLLEGSPPLELKTTDISPRGAFLRTSDPPPVGTRARARLVFPHLREPVESLCDVRHRRADGFGVRFDPRDADVQRRLDAAFTSPGE